MAEIKSCPELKTKEHMLKMKYLVEATGVAKSTILYYLNRGLLPKPLKTSANMAYYDSECIERIGFIKQLQSSHRLGLAQIKTVLHQRDKGREITPSIEMAKLVFGQSNSNDLDKPSFCQATGLTMSQVDKFLAHKVLIPRKKDKFDSEDVVFGKMLFKTIELGIKPGDTAFYRHFAEKIVNEEMAIHKCLIQDQSHKETMSLTLELTRIARAFRAYVIDRVFQERAYQQDIN
ncbi:MAG: MerR family transcriptional regulator [Thermodesulfobacteriota bacterium]